MIRIDFDRLRFLVVDDNPHMRRILRALLLGFGSRDIHEAQDGAVGLEAFNKITPAVPVGRARRAFVLTLPRLSHSPYAAARAGS